MGEDRIKAEREIRRFSPAGFHIGVATDENRRRAVAAGFAPAPEDGDIAFDPTLIRHANHTPGRAFLSREEDDARDFRPVLFDAEALKAIALTLRTTEVHRSVECRRHVLAPFLSLLVISFCSLRKISGGSFS